MGKKLFDGSSKGHFYGGVVSGILFFPKQIMLSFLISHGLHFGIELLENNYTLCGQLIESRGNHIGDMLAFFGGWLLAITYKFYRLCNIYVLIVLWVVFLYYNCKEILREVFPLANNRFFSGAYRGQEKKCYLHKTIK